MGRKRVSRIYWREQGGERRAYADFRDFADAGGKREALIPKGAKVATTDEKLALALVSARIEELESRRRRKQRGQPVDDTFLAAYSEYHLTRKAKAGKVTDAWLQAAQMHLEAAVTFFCNGGEPLRRDSATGDALLDEIEDHDLTSISVEDVQAYVDWLAERGNGRGGRLSASSQRKYLNSLSNLYRRAASEQRVPPGFNPVAAMMEKPQEASGRGEAAWLEVHEAALLLESARTYQPKRPDAALPPEKVHAIIATMLLTGGRPAEVLGLEVRDVSLRRKTVTFRPNEGRERLKTAGSWRTVPLWPQLEVILSAYLDSAGHPKPSALLFPSGRTDGRITDLRKSLDAIASRVGWEPGEIRPYSFRHTFTAARLQTLDRGHPVSIYTVAKELGHGGDSLVKRVYGHLGEVRHRREVVEYRVEHFQEELKGRLAPLSLSRVA